MSKPQDVKSEKCLDVCKAVPRSSQLSCVRFRSRPRPVAFGRTQPSPYQLLLLSRSENELTDRLVEILYTVQLYNKL